MRKWCGVLRSGGALLVVAGAALWLASASLVSGQETARMWVSPVSQNVALGSEMFIVDIKVENVENVGAYEITMTFDPDVLEYTGIQESEFIYSTGRQVTCLGSGTPAATVNSRGGFNLNCSSNGLIENNAGKPGPSTNGETTIASVAFVPKGVGVSDLRFRAYDPNEGPYVFDGSSAGGQTQLSSVEVCETVGNDTECDDAIGIDMDVQNGVVKVFDPNAPTPTGVPATPTKVPPAPERDVQATVQAALGTPSGRLATPVPGSGGSTTSGTLPGSTRGGRNLPAGTTRGNAGANVGPDGAPIAGHGPQSTDAVSWPRTAGAALALAGVVIAGAGTAIRRRGA